MPSYEFYCSHCEKSIDIFLSFDEYDKLKNSLGCAVCETDLVQHFGTPHIYCRPEPKTVGLGAARNTEKMGRYHYEDKVREATENRTTGKETFFDRVGAGSKVTKSAPEPWYGRPTKEMANKINSMTQSQKMDYIIKGKVT